MSVSYKFILAFCVLMLSSNGGYAGLFDELKKDLGKLGNKIGVTDDSEESKSKPAAVNSPGPVQIHSGVVLNADRNSVLLAQRKLSALGFNVGKPDGIYGQKTKSAISSYQKSQGLNVTGNVTAGLLERLDKQVVEPGTVAKGNDDVASAQTGDRVTGALGGAVIGGGLGAAIGGKKGAAIGTGAGIIVGGLVGNEMANKRADYSEKYREIDAGIEDAQSENLRLSVEISDLNNFLYEQNKSLQEIVEDNREYVERKSDLESMLRGVEDKIDLRQSLLDDYLLLQKTIEEDILIVESVIEDLGSDAEFEKRRQVLEEQLLQAQSAYKQVMGIEDGLIAQKQKLQTALDG